MNIILSIALISGLIWLYLIFFRGQFWQTNQQLDLSSPSLTDFPLVCAIIPARNEADVLPISLPSLLQQNYPNLQVILIDDQSTDDTGKIAEDLAASLGKTSKLHLISGADLPPGWSGKLWALNQGVEFAHNLPQKPDYFLFTDADILHDPDNINHLINHSIKNNLDLVSLMVLLRCTSIWERFLIPAFVFFFAKLYPFQWVNNHQNKTAAAAGGCILIKRDILTKIGGIEILRQALIDDCTLAKYVKDSGGKIWLGLTKLNTSLRPYNSLSTIWDMVARTAFTQLNYSPFLLLGTVLAMSLVYLTAPFSTIYGLIMLNLPIAIAGLFTWILMSISYFPIIKFYQISPLWVITLPLISLFYTLMTIDSALRFYIGQGGKWKGRVYQLTMDN